MGKLQNFSVTQILNLREINVGESKESKIAILARLEALNCEICEIFSLYED